MFKSTQLWFPLYYKYVTRKISMNLSKSSPIDLWLRVVGKRSWNIFNDIL